MEYSAAAEAVRQIDNHMIDDNDMSYSTVSINAKTIEELYNEAYACVDQGICFDEIGQRDGALAMYERGLRLIDGASEIQGCQQSEMYQKMVRAREHIVYRLKDLRSGAEGVSRPSIGDLTSPIGEVPPPYEAITNTLNAMGSTKNADEMLSIPDGVQVFFIRGDETSVPSYPAPLKIFKFTSTDTPDAPPAFLQVGDWVYPLVPGRSPVLHSTYGAYMFTNPSVDAPDAYVGVILPSDLDASLVQEFEALMKRFTAYKEDTTQPPLTQQESQRLATKIASFLIKSGEFLATTVKTGTTKTTTYIGKQSSSIREKSAKTEKPVTIDPRVQSSVHYLRKGTKVAIKISGYLVDKVGLYASIIGKSLASSAEKRIEKSSKGGARTIHDVLEVATAGVAGVSTVWMSLEEAAKILAKSLATNTVQVVDHKYGEQAAGVTNDLLYSTGFAAGTAWNVENLGIKAIAKRSAKEASVAFLKDLSKTEKMQKSDDEAAAHNKDASSHNKEGSTKKH